MIGPSFARASVHAESPRGIGTPPETALTAQRENPRDSIPKKLFALFMAMVLAASLVPGVAWAEAGTAVPKGETSADAASGVPATVSDDTIGGADKSSNESESGIPSDTDGISNGGEAGDSFGEGSPSAGLEESPDQLGGDTAGQAGDGLFDSSPDTSGSAQPGEKGASDESSDTDTDARAFSEAFGIEGSAPLASGMQLRSASSLDSDGFVWIEKSKGSGWGYSSNQVKGDVQAGTTLWANHYDYDEYCVDGAFAYQWYASATKSVDVADYEPIEGATSQSFVIDADFAREHDGEYLLVSVSDGHTTLTGPTSTSYAAQIAGTVKVTSVSFTNGGVQYLMAGETLETRAYPSDAEPTYVWEQAPSKTGPFEIIEGATESTIELTDELVGTYLRVTATTGSTSKQATTNYPVAAKGSWLVKKVELSSDIGAYEGAVLTAQAYGTDPQHSSNTPIDSAQATFTWQYADSDSYSAVWTDIPGASGRGLDTYTVDAAYAGAYLRAVVDAGVESWIGKSSAFGPIKSVPKLSSIELSVGGRTVDYAVAGDAVAATVLDESGQAVTDNLAYSWQSAPSENGPFTPLAGADGASCVVPDNAANAYLRLTVAGLGEGNGAERTFAVYAPDSLEAVANALRGYVPVPNSDENVSLATMVEEEIAALGFEGVSVSLASTSDENIVAADGVITGWFYADPSTVSAGDPCCNTVEVAFALSKDGRSVEFVPGENGEVNIGWDRARVRDAIVQDLLPQVELADYLNKVDSSLDEITKYTKDLPTATGWANVSWASSNEELVKITDDPYALVNQFERKKLTGDAPVAITATFATAFADADGSTIAVDKRFDCIVKKFVDVSSLTSIDLKALLEKNYTIGKLADFATGEAIDPAAVTGDIQLPIPRDLFVEAHELQITVTSSNDAVVKVNGYRAFVYQPIDGRDRDVVLTVTLASKDKPSVKASLEIELTVQALDMAALDAELALMEEVKAAYAEGIKGGNASTDAVTNDMASFQEVYRDEASGELVWVRDRADRVDYGIVPDELDGWYDSQMWRCFRSSDASIIAHENLLVTRPAYNTAVTVKSVLTSEVYGKYYELYRDDPNVSAEFKAKLAALYRQPVSCAVTVCGTTGQDDPAGDKDTVAVSVAITGVTGKQAGGSYTPESWVPRSRVIVEKGQNVTAWDCFAQLLDENEYAYTSASGLNPYSITSPEGRTLTTVRQGSTKNSYWAFFINGVYADLSTRAYEVKEGDFIELRYLDATGSREEDPLAVETVPDAEHPDLGASWAGHGNGGAGAVVEGIETPVAGVEAAACSLLTEAERAAGAEAFASDPLIIGGKLYIVSGSKTIDPNTGRATVSKARLSIVDPATNTATSAVELATAMDTTCRPAYADGIIVIPLSGGYLQALSAETLDTLWTAPPAQGSQALATLTIADGSVYASTVDELSGDNDRATKGTLYCYDLYTGDRIGKASNEAAGYYWTGGVKVGDCFVVPDDAGTVTAYTADLKEVVSSVLVDEAGIRSSLAIDGDTIYAVSKAGVLYRLRLEDPGMTARSGEDRSVPQLVQVGDGLKFAQSSTSTPTIANGMLFVGGLADDSTGSLSVIDLGGWSIRSSVSGLTATSDSTDPSVQCAPLVSVRDDGTYVYFTSNRKPGGVYLYKLGDEAWSEFFVPEEGSRDYCISSIVCGADGTLYYTNDSGTLFALKAASKVPGDPDPVPDPDPDPETPAGTGKPAPGSGNAGHAATQGDSSGAVWVASPLASAGAGARGLAAPLLDGAASPEANADGAVPRSASSAGGSEARAGGSLGSTPSSESTVVLNGWAVAGLVVGGVLIVGVALFAFGPLRRRSLREPK